jgi:hypothetical protein
VSERTDGATGLRTRRNERRGRGEPGAEATAGFADWPGTVRVVASQPTLWWRSQDPEPAPVASTANVVRLGPEALVVGGELALSRETGQSFALMGLMALVLTLFVGLGMLAVRMLV